MNFFMTCEASSDVSFQVIDIVMDLESKLKLLEKNDYGSSVVHIGIIPIVVNISHELEKAGFFKERILYKAKIKEADIRLRIDHDKFFDADYEGKRLLIIKNIIESVRALKGKVKKDFSGEMLENDILNLFGLTTEKLNSI